MTVTNLNLRAVGVGNGAATTFAYTFRILDQRDLAVYLIDTTQSPPVVTPQTLNTNYTVTGVGLYAGGNVVFSVPPANGISVLITRQMALQQPTDMRNQGPYFAETMEDSYDRTAMLDQQIADGLSRAVRLPVTDLTGANTTLPAPAPNSAIGWGPTGLTLVNLLVGNAGIGIPGGAASLDLNGRVPSAQLSLAADKNWGTNETTTTGLTYGYYGGAQWNGTSWSFSGGGTLALPANQTSYVQRTPAGVVTSNTSGFTASQIPMAVVVTGASTITAVTDYLSTSVPYAALTTSNGATIVGYNEGGTGAVTRTVALKFSDFALSILDFGGVADGVTDNSAALNAAHNEALAKNKTCIYFPGSASSYVFTAKPANFTQGVMLCGDGQSTSVLSRNYNPGSGTEGFLTWVGGNASGGGLSDIGVITQGGRTTGAAIALTATASVRPGNMLFKNTNVSISVNGTDSWNYAFYLDGSLYTTAGSQGIRGIYVLGCSFFAANVDTVFLKNAVHFEMSACQVVLAGGTVGTVHVTGGGTATSNSTAVTISSTDIVGSLILDNCSQVVANGYASTGVTAASTATNCFFSGDTPTVTNSSSTFGWSTASAGCGGQSYAAVGTGAGNRFTARYNTNNEQSGLVSGSSGATYFVENVNYNGADQYSVTGLVASRWGNPGGAAAPWRLDVAPAGTAGTNITWTQAVSVDSNGNFTAVVSMTAPTFTWSGTGAGNRWTARYNGSNEQAGLYTNIGGATYFGENVNSNAGTDQYSVATPAASRWGNPGGSPTVPWTLYVAAPGAAGTNITWTVALSADTSGNVSAAAAFGIRGKAFTANGATTTFTYPANTSYQYITTSAASLATTLPATSATVDGLVISFCTSAAVGTATWVAGTGGATIVGAPSALAANTPVRFIYHHATTSWYPF